MTAEDGASSLAGYSSGRYHGALQQHTLSYLADVPENLQSSGACQPSFDLSFSGTTRWNFHPGLNPSCRGPEQVGRVHCRVPRRPPCHRRRLDTGAGTAICSLRIPWTLVSDSQCCVSEGSYWSRACSSPITVHFWMYREVMCPRALFFSYYRTFLNVVHEQQVSSSSYYRTFLKGCIGIQ